MLEAGRPTSALMMMSAACASGLRDALDRVELHRAEQHVARLLAVDQQIVEAVAVEVGHADRAGEPLLFLRAFEHEGVAQVRREVVGEVDARQRARHEARGGGVGELETPEIGRLGEPRRVLGALGRLEPLAVVEPQRIARRPGDAEQRTD